MTASADRRRPAGRARVLNLCFHGIGVPGRSLEPDEGQYWVEPAQFEDMLAVVRRCPWLRITFDDGNASDAGLALPALVTAGVTASFFVVAGRLGETGCLAADDVRALVRAGMTVGSHGMRHRSWRSLQPAALREELVDAPAIIGDAAGVRIRHAACPFGAYDRRVLRRLRNHSFERVYTVDPAPAHVDDWLQPRYTIRKHDSAEAIEQLGRRWRSARGAGKRALKRWR